MKDSTEYFFILLQAYTHKITYPKNLWKKNNPWKLAPTNMIPHYL